MTAKKHAAAPAAACFLVQGSAAQFGKQIRREIFRQAKI